MRRPSDDTWDLLWRHRDRLVGIARRWGFGSVAEDVAHDAILRCALYPSLDPERAGVLLSAITTRLCIDLSRRRAAEARMWSTQQEPGEDDYEVVLRAAEAAWLDATVPLTDVEAAVLAGRMYGEVPRETAVRLGITLKSAESALTRARRKMLAAWRATLVGVGALRLRRLIPATGAAVVVALAVLASAPVLRLGDGIEGQASVTEGVREARSHEREADPLASARRLRPSRTPEIAAPTTPPPARETTTITVVPKTKVGPVRQDGVDLILDHPEDVPERVVECATGGVKVVLSPDQISVVCSTDSGWEVGGA